MREGEGRPPAGFVERVVLPWAGCGIDALSPNGVLFHHAPASRFGDRTRGLSARVSELLTSTEQDAVVDLVAYEPTCGDLIPGTGGLRKVRIAVGGRGKRGGARVVYYFHEADMPVFLLALYAKNEKDDLTAAEKKEFSGLTKDLVRQWRRK